VACREVKLDSLRQFARDKGFATDEQLDAALTQDTLINGKPIADDEGAPF
jgi:hypothetical protein